MHKLTRIAYNSEHWQRPSGDARRLESLRSFTRKYGFGHEEWLLRNDWLIDGWRYAFIQGVNKSHRKLVAATEPFDLTLFTIQPDKKRRYVATIRQVECLANPRAQDALAHFRSNGWLHTMRKEVKAIDGKVTALGDTHYAKNILNIRFRLENLNLWLPHQFAAVNDQVMRLKRYQLVDFNTDETSLKKSSLRRRAGRRDALSLKPHTRHGPGLVKCTPEHGRIQAKLLEQLVRKYGPEAVTLEEDFVDALVRTPTEEILHEIKTHLHPRAAIREALGQILEYAYHPDRKHRLPVRMVIVGRTKLGSAEAAYLAHLRDVFSLPVEYCHVAI